MRTNTLFLLAITLFCFTQSIAAPPPPVGSAAWIELRRRQLQDDKEIEKAERKAEKRRANFEAAEKLARSENESQEAAGKRIAAINARLKLQPAIDAGFKSDAEAIVLTMATRLEDTDFDLVRWWEPVDSRKLAETMEADYRSRVSAQTAKYTTATTQITALKDESKGSLPAEKKAQVEKQISELTATADAAQAEVKRLEKRHQEFGNPQTLRCHKLCFESKAKGKWLPQVWFFVMFPDGRAILVGQKADVATAEAEFREAGK